MSQLPILFINLDKDSERRARMEQQLQQLHLCAQRLPAVWWQDLSTQQKALHHKSESTHHRYFKPLGNGEKGCYCSHLAACRALLESDAPALVVFEDDVQLLPSLPKVLKAIQTLPAENWDMIKLYGRAREKIASRRPSGVPGHEWITYRRVPSFAAGYAISRLGAEKILRSRIPFERPVDVDIRFWFENDLRIFGVYPSVIALEDTSFTSSIWPQKEAPMTLSQRLRKLAMKLQLTWGNAWAKHPHVRDLG